MRTPDNGIASQAAPKLRILLLARDCNPGGTHGHLIGYSHARELARLHTVTLVIHRDHVEAVRCRDGGFDGIEGISLGWLDRFHAWCFRRFFKNNYFSQALTAFNYFFYIAFEFRAWRKLRRRIVAGDFDLVLRLVPVSAVLPSPFAYFLRRGPVPFVIGPINGGLPWPTGFAQAAKQKEWISNLRSLYRFFPFARSTYREAAAIIAGSSQTCLEFSKYRDKLFFVPGENGINPSHCPPSLRGEGCNGSLELIFVGGLFPVKAVDLALRGAAPLLRKDQARFTVVGDGPERSNLERLAKTLNVAQNVLFPGWLPHSEVMQRLAAADVLLFPSLRDFGGGVVFEALAMGAVPVVVDFGGPGDIVHSEVGFKVPLTNEDQMVAEIERILRLLARDPGKLCRMRKQGIRYAREHLSWEGKARMVSDILCWVTGRGAKPHLPPPNEKAARENRSCAIQPREVTFNA